MQKPETVTVETQTLFCDGESISDSRNSGASTLFRATTSSIGATGHGVPSPDLRGDDLGHPRVYLTMKDGAVDCPYCGRHFILAKGAKKAAAH
jgi:uncharacterized Zn-finger protein